MSNASQDPPAPRGSRLLLSGPELILRGLREAQPPVQVVTGSVGAPLDRILAGVYSAHSQLQHDGTRVVPAQNDLLAASTFAGAVWSGQRAVAMINATGLRRASEPIAELTRPSRRQAREGLIITGEQTWSAEERGYVRRLAESEQLPLLEPGRPQQVKDWVSTGLRLSRETGRPCLMSLNTLTADTGGTVVCAVPDEPGATERSGNHSGIHSGMQDSVKTARSDPGVSPPSHKSLSDLHAYWIRLARQMGVNALIHRPSHDEPEPVGLVAVGVAEPVLSRALGELQMLGRVPMLHLGMVWPVDYALIADLAKGCERLVVVESGPAFVERALRAHPVEGASPDESGRRIPAVPVYGRRFPDDQPGIPEQHIVRVDDIVASLSRLLSMVNPRWSPPKLPRRPSRDDTPGDRAVDDQAVVGPLVTGNQTSDPADVAISAGSSASSRPATRHPGPDLTGRSTPASDELSDTARTSMSLPVRSTTFCPGCPHRDTTSALDELVRNLRDPEYMLQHHRRKPVEVICNLDHGCASLTIGQPQHRLTLTHAGYGAAAGIAQGWAHTEDGARHLVIVGDGSFFQNGASGISQAIAQQANVVFLVMDNHAAAMLGQNVTPHESTDVFGRDRTPQSIERMIQAMFPDRGGRKQQRVTRINPENRSKFIRLMERVLLGEGVHVVIADKACGLVRQRKQRAAVQADILESGFQSVEARVHIDETVCEHCLECTRKTACTGLVPVNTDFGPKIQTEKSWCVNDGACHRIEACPAFARVTITRRQPARALLEPSSLGTLPDPPRPIHADQDAWRCAVVGVGGQGVLTATAVLARAGHAMGYRVQYRHRRPLAPRLQPVIGQVAFTREKDGASAKGSSTGPRFAVDPAPVIPRGGADVLLGLDPLETVRACDTTHGDAHAGPHRTSGILNTAHVPTTSMLIGSHRAHRDQWVDTMRTHVRPDGFWPADFARISETFIGSTKYLNMVVLGAALQWGCLPLTVERLEQAVRDELPDDAGVNLRALRLGRAVAADPQRFTSEEDAPESTRHTIRRLTRMLHMRRRGRKGRRVARRYRVTARKITRDLAALGVPPELQRDVVIRLHACVVWGRQPYAEQYAETILRIAGLDVPRYGFALTRAAVWNLAKVMLIKDEFYVAELLTSPEKHARDRLTFNAVPARGDRVDYVYLTQPQIRCFGLRLSFNWSARPWQLRWLRACRRLRSLLPGWHQEEVEFRDWYLELVQAASWSSPGEYYKWVALLGVPASVTGFRDVREQRMTAARRQAERILKSDPETFVADHTDPPRRLPVVA